MCRTVKICYGQITILNKDSNSNNFNPTSIFPSHSNGRLVTRLDIPRQNLENVQVIFPNLQIIIKKISKILNTKVPNWLYLFFEARSFALEKLFASRNRCCPRTDMSTCPVLAKANLISYQQLRFEYSLQRTWRTVKHNILVFCNSFFRRSGY